MPTQPSGVLVLLHNRYACWLAERLDKSKHYCGLLAAPGGTIEPGEEPHVAAFREVEEETGLRLEPEQLTYAGESQHVHDDITFTMHQFRAELRPGQEPLDMEPTKQGQWRQWPKSFRFDKLVTPGTAVAIELWQQMRQPY